MDKISSYAKGFLETTSPLRLISAGTGEVSASGIIHLHSHVKGLASSSFVELLFIPCAEIASRFRN